MSANNYRPHLLVLSEDKANRQIVNGFSQYHQVDGRRMHIEPVARGWIKVLECFQNEHIALMHKFPDRKVLIVLDLDEREDRIEVARNYIPESLKERVFLLSCADEPEKLMADLGCKEEEIGRRLAKDCDHETLEMWGHKMLAHNVVELAKLRDEVKPFLFK